MGDRNEPVMAAALRLAEKSEHTDNTNSTNSTSKVSRAHNARPHDARKLRISLKQWRMLHAVIDCDGFADAAKSLHLSQSAISYTVAKMQAQLGVPILKLVGRKAHITEAGRMLLEQSRYLLKDALALEAFAEQLRQGGGTQLQLVVDHDFPTSMLMRALRQFAQPDCMASVHLHEGTMHEAVKALTERTADLAITHYLPPDFLGDPLIELEYVAVAHPQHGLFELARHITAADLKQQVKIVVGNAQDLLHGASMNPSPGSLQHWRVTSIDTAITALREGLGFAWLPTHRIEEQVNQGLLKLLPLMDGGRYKRHFYLVHGHHRGANSAASKLADILRAVTMAHRT